MSSSSALSFIATSSSGGIALLSTRCCQPAVSVRFESTVTKPLSSSITASRMVCCGFKWTALVSGEGVTRAGRREGLYAAETTGAWRKALRSQDFYS
jgi:hypothetical protein